MTSGAKRDYGFNFYGNTDRPRPLPFLPSESGSYYSLGNIDGNYNYKLLHFLIMSLEASTTHGYLREIGTESLSELGRKDPISS
jgi:hypothetical protein